MHTTTLLPLFLPFPFLSSATPQSPPVQIPPQNPASDTNLQPQPTPTPNATPSPPAPTTTLNPQQLNDKFLADYASLFSAASTNPVYNVLATAVSAGGVPRFEANAQEATYINALFTATASVAEPAYITGLPQDQQSWVRGFHAQIASVAAAVDFATTTTTPAPSGSSSVAAPSSTSGYGSNGTDGVVPPPVAGQNGTSIGVNGTTSVQPPQSTTVAPPPLGDLPTATPAPTAGNATNGTDGTSGAMGLGGERGGLWGMVGAGLVGVVGVMALL
ncbi:MAG: hypothetical protein Q9166_005994 [cf. Caloplaca sp. 2 TL-2023]